MAIMDMRELTPEEMEEVEGGYVVYRGFWKNVWVVDDVTGKKLGEEWFTSDAKGMAIKKGVSEKKISYSEYKKMFNK